MPKAGIIVYSQEDTCGQPSPREHGMKKPIASRRGFTLVELLVVVTIIALLIALLLPAVQMAREAARRMQCGNNLKQLGLATMGYEQAHGTLPAGSNLYDDSGEWNAIYRGGIHLRLLPFLEQQPLYDLFDFNKGIDGQRYPGTSRPLGATVLSVYVCPSDQPSSPWSATNIAKTNYLASAGPLPSGNASPTCAMVTLWNRYSTGSEPNHYPGPFGRCSNYCRLTEITDGLSNTILFGEQRPACNQALEITGWAGSNNTSGYCRTSIPINWNSCDQTGSDGCRRYDYYWSVPNAFRSFHPGGAGFLLGDGSVQFLPETIDFQTYQYLGNKADGKVVQFTW